MGELCNIVTGVLMVTALAGMLFSVMLSSTNTDAKVLDDRRSSETRNKANLKLDLDGNDWIIIAGNDSRVHGMTFPASVPGTMYTALEAAGFIGDPYYRFNDLDYRWVHLDNWTYTKSFKVSAELVAKPAILLICEGLDTIATVYVNGQVVGTGANQFVRYVYDVTGILVEGDNRIDVAFTSAVEYSETQFDDHPYRIPPDCVPEMYKGECHVNMIRKAACSFSWDWGPAFATQGIWKSIWIEGNDLASIRDIVPHVTKDELQQEWLLNVTLHFDVALDITGGRVRVEFPAVGIAFFLVDVTLNKGKDAVTMADRRMHEDLVDTWWPRGYGEQPMYDIIVTLEDATHTVVAEKTTKMAFRTVVTVEDPLPTGLTFYFVVNGVPIYMKGSNWIPIDSFLDRITSERLTQLLESAAATNMNTIRIWGGGVYESDEFYDIADELGILIWQDLMLACNMYPVDAAYLDNVRDEMIYQVRRLAHHPCVVAWTANNENEGALVDDWYGTAGPLYERYKSDYLTLYIDTMRDAILGEDYTRPFLPSSPTNGKMTEQNGWISEDPKPSSPHYGDIHYYNYDDDCLDHNIYLPTRYASEYGYQSWPSHHTLSKVSQPGDLIYGSAFTQHRQHHYGAGNGTEQIVRRHFTWPDTGDAETDFKHIIYLFQAAQAICYKTQTEFYRRARSDPVIRNMGALYWQHSDIWQAPTWATIDFDGTWKMAHYYGAHFFADPMISSINNGSDIDVYTVTDATSDVTDVDLVIRLWDWSSVPGTFLYQWTVSTTVPAAGSTLAYSRDLTDLLSEGGCPERARCVLTLHLETTANGRISPINPHHLTSWKDAVGITRPGIEIQDVTMIATRVFEVTMTTNKMAAFVWLEAVGVKGYFSNNGFLWVESTGMTLTFIAWQDVTEGDLLASTTVKSLADIY